MHRSGEIKSAHSVRQSVLLGHPKSRFNF